MEPVQHGLCASSSSQPIAIPRHAIAQKRVLITGAGGSIGAALAHAVAALSPQQMLLLEVSEQALFQIDRELAAPHTSILANTCDTQSLEELFERHRPHVVLHAAAYKHVTLMERHPFAVIQNNTVGTFTLTQTAVRHRTEQFVIVSTDKAVDPTSIMGVSKRLAELTALALQTPATKIKAVRLPNVYGSQGSVVPLFEAQISQNIPVTVTHPEATRYFITLEQAAALLLHSLSEIFQSAILIPELPPPVRIEEIARHLIEKSASNSKIVYTGLRPGEKLHELLLSNSESLLDGSEPLRVVQSESISPAEAVEAIALLQSAIQARDLSRLLHAVTSLIPAYIPSETLLDLPAFSECRG